MQETPLGTWLSSVRLGQPGQLGFCHCHSDMPAVVTLKSACGSRWSTLGRGASDTATGLLVCYG